MPGLRVTSARYQDLGADYYDQRHARPPPADRIRHHIDELFASDRPLPDTLEEVARLGAQLLMQAAARLTRSGRRRRLKIPATWPWADAIVIAWTRIAGLPQAP